MAFVVEGFGRERLDAEAEEVVDVEVEFVGEAGFVLGGEDGLVWGLETSVDAVGLDVGGEAAAMRFGGNCGARAGSGGMVGLMEGGDEELRRLPRDEEDGVVFFAGWSGGVYWVPASTVVFEEWLDVDKVDREGAMVGEERPGNAAAGGRRM